MSQTAAPGPGDGLEDLRAVLGEAGLDAAPSQVAALGHYVRLLQRWNAVYNLTAVRDPAAVLVQHVADSLSLVRPLRREVASAARGGVRVLDVGSGGGLPAIPLAILEPSWSVTCVEPVGKKTAFLRQAAAECSLPNLAAYDRRVEDLPLTEPYHWITSRAYSSLARLVEGTRHQLAPDGRWVAMKGVTPDAEIAEVRDTADVFHVEQLHVPRLEAARCLVWMRPFNA